MVNARIKGHGAEREFIHYLEKNGIAGLARNLDQTRDGGPDILGLPRLCIEVKRCEILNIEKWWQQTLNEIRGRQIPVLAYRQSRKHWTIITLGNIIYSRDLTRVTINIDDWIKWIRMNISMLRKK
jgi:Holliday junction resolvase